MAEGALLALVLVSRVFAGDADEDGLDDGLEDALAHRFFPDLNMHAGTFKGVAHGSYGQFYGGGAFTRDEPLAVVPFVARPVAGFTDASTGARWCDGPVRCVEVMFGLPYSWDLGDDVFGRSHRGDSESVGVLLAHGSPLEGEPAAWAASWEVARGDATAWRRVKTFAAAHMCALGDSSGFRTDRSADALGVAEAPRLWVAEGKNATYTGQRACKRGAILAVDDCSEERVWIEREPVLQRLRNMGEEGASGFDTRIAWPAQSRGGPLQEAQELWTAGPFGKSTPWRFKLGAGILDWGAESWSCPSKQR
ncbi:MAG: hypothetical protein KTR31_02690 [Myxococcales bacterium]|nr:hypothetical protein [Myxococcales bacterium]